MISDEERREVAEKLRASIPGDGVMRRGDKGWSLLYRTIFGHYMNNQSAGRTYSEVAGRLADLIDPDKKMAQDSPRHLEEVKASDGIVSQADRETLQVTYSRSTGGPDGKAYMVKVRHRDKGWERDFYAVDREALLALADEMDRHADMAAGHVAYAARFDFAGWARRIREALGVDDGR